MREYDFRSLSDLMSDRQMLVTDMSHGMSVARDLADMYYDVDSGHALMGKACLMMVCEGLASELASDDYVASCTYETSGTEPDRLGRLSGVHARQVSEALISQIFSVSQDRNMILEIVLTIHECTVLFGPDFRVYDWTLNREAAIEKDGSSIFVHYRNETQTLSALCDRVGISLSSALGRLDKGMDMSSIIPGALIEGGG